MLYFAYGSNMDKPDLDKWCRNHNYPPVKILSTEVTVLKGYELKFNYNSHTSTTTLRMLKILVCETENADKS